MNAYFTMYNQSDKVIPQGDQIFYQYGGRSDDFLASQYNFCLDPDENNYSSWKVRVLIGVNPIGEIEDISEFIPTQAILDDYENLDKVTDLINVKRYRLCEQLLEYMRHTMSYHYSELGGLDPEYLMISCPRVIDFEKLIVDWAIKLLLKISQEELFKRKSLEEEEKELDGLDEIDYQLYTITKLNVIMKHICNGQLKTLKVLKAILDRVTDVDIDDDSAYARATHLPVENLETDDTEEELFRRRMGMRNYLKLLKMSRVAVRNAKQAKEEAKQSAPATEQSASTVTGEVTPKQATAALEAASKA